MLKVNKMPNTISKLCLVMITALALQACNLLPGMRLNTSLTGSNAYDHNQPNGGPNATQLVRITPDVVRRQAPRFDDAFDRQRLAPLIRRSEEVYVYRLGVGDVLSVRVLGHPELSTEIEGGEGGAQNPSAPKVQPSGNIYFPLVGEIPVVSLSVQQVREKIAKGLARYIEDPQVSVRVTAFRSQRIYITNNLDAGGIPVPITDVEFTLLDALNSLTEVFAQGQGTEYLILTRGKQRYRIALRQIINEGAVLPKITLFDKDVLYFESATNDRIFMLGETFSRGPLPMINGRMTLAEALTSVGGVSPLTGDASKVFVVRRLERYSDLGETYNSAVVFHLDATVVDSMVLADQFNLQPRDVVFVSETGLTTVNRFLGQILPTLILPQNVQRTRRSVLLGP